MSVLIKSMAMPDGCVVCPFFIENHHDRGDDSLCRASGKEAKYGCPLIPVPKHGRLIDADALPTYDKPIGKMMMFGGEYVYTQTAIDNAPTIIPADKEGEG